MKQKPTITTLSLGGGVQSSAIAEMIAEGVLPIPNLILFADTGDEPQYVYDQIAYLKKRLFGLCEFQTVSAGNLVDELTSGTKRFAAIPVFTVMKDNGKVSRLRRQCTNEYKIVPIERAVREYLLSIGHAKRDKRGITIPKTVFIETWLGISLDEVVRMKPSRSKRFINRWPLIEMRMTRQDCLDWLRARGLPILRKSSCRICPYHDNVHWQEMKQDDPQDWKHVVAFDDFLRAGDGRFSATAKGELFMHRDCVPLSQVDLRPKHEQEGQLSFLDICDEGHCFI